MPGSTTLATASALYEKCIPQTADRSFFLTSPLGAFAENTDDPTANQQVANIKYFIVSTASDVVFPFSGTEITTPNGQQLRYYVSDTSTRKMPMVIFLRGSGCTGAFSNHSDGRRIMGPEAFALKFSESSRLIVIDNPGIEKRFASESAIGCSSDFKRAENMQTRLEALRLIVNDLRSRGWVNRSFMIFAGSEGVPLAIRFARFSKEVSHLFLISGFGIGQSLATVHAALTGWGNWSFIDGTESSDQPQALHSTLARWEQVHRGQGRDSSEMIAGHGELYWYSIGTASPAEDALATEAKLYLVQGGTDQNAPSVNYEAGIAYLVAHGRPFISEYIPCGDHFLICASDRGNPKNLQGVVARGMDWFLTGRIQKSSVASFNPALPTS